MTRLARGRTLGRITAELGLQFHQIGEDVGLAPQFVGDHRGWLEIVEMTVTRTPRRCTASTSGPAPSGRYGPVLV